MEEAAPLIRLRGVGKTFPGIGAGGTEALAGLDLDVREGELLGLVGPSGCGKSTVLRLIAGLAEPTEGTVERPRDLALGFVFQEPTLMPWATAEANVALPLRLRGEARQARRERARELLAAVGLEGFAGAYPRQLSGGMKMRVSIARALAARPRLLLLDEPFAALDEIARNQLNDDLLALRRREALTLVFVTHSVHESAYLADRVAVFTARPGRVAAEVRIAAPVERGSPEYQQACREISARLAEVLP